VFRVLMQLRTSDCTKKCCSNKYCLNIWISITPTKTKVCCYGKILCQYVWSGSAMTGPHYNQKRRQNEVLGIPRNSGLGNGPVGRIIPKSQTLCAANVISVDIICVHAWRGKHWQPRVPTWTIFKRWISFKGQKRVICKEK
jgi:hypothetical protein